MDSVDTEVLKSAIAWLNANHQAMLATVVKTWGSAPRPVGAMLAIRDDGLVSGSVSGGCVEDDLIERVKGHAFKDARPELVKYGVTQEQAARAGLPCGGTLQLVLEPLKTNHDLKEILTAVGRHELIVRELDFDSGKSVLRPGLSSDELEFDNQRLKTVHGPRWRLLIIGAGQTSRYIAQMAQALDYHVTVCDPREEYAGGWDVPNAPIDRRMPDDVVVAMNTDPHSAIVAMTHDPKLDDMALLEALKSPAFYIGALGSRANNEKRRARLAQFDLTVQEIARLHGPIGLPIGSRTPPEIAISILAEMTAVRRGVALDTAMAKPGIANSPAGDPLTCK